MAERQWRPADGAEQTDSSLPAAEERLADDFWTAENRSDEDSLGFDAVYATWRDENGAHHDDLYRQWRAQTGKTFSQAFLDWVERQRKV